MTTWTQLHPDDSVLLGRVWFKDPGYYNYAVPAAFPTYPGVAPKFMRAMGVASGGQGANWSGGGAFARSVVPVTVGLNLQLHVGLVQQANTENDTWVLGLYGATIIHCDRGRGTGVKGTAINSVGDVTRDGQSGGVDFGGGCGSDAGDFGGLGFGGVGADYAHTVAADFGCGGHYFPYANEYGVQQGVVAWAAGTGLICLEFFDSNPGY